MNYENPKTAVFKCVVDVLLLRVSEDGHFGLPECGLSRDIKNELLDTYMPTSLLAHCSMLFHLLLSTTSYETLKTHQNNSLSQLHKLEQARKPTFNLLTELTSQSDSLRVRPSITSSFCAPSFPLSKFQTQLILDRSVLMGW